MNACIFTVLQIQTEDIKAVCWQFLSFESQKCKNHVNLQSNNMQVTFKLMTSAAPQHVYTHDKLTIYFYYYFTHLTVKMCHRKQLKVGSTDGLRFSSLEV